MRWCIAMVLNLGVPAPTVLMLAKNSLAVTRLRRFQDNLPFKILKVLYLSV